MHEDYAEAVLQNYRDLREANKLSFRLAYPTPGKLKRECILAYSDRFERKDDKALRDFFEVNGPVNSWIKVIGKFDTDKFRPLVNFLKNPSYRTSEAKIEIIAWLIGFKFRPFDVTIGFPPKEETPPVIQTEPEPLKTPITNPNKADEKVPSGNSQDLPTEEVENTGEVTDLTNDVTLGGKKPQIEIASTVIPESEPDTPKTTLLKIREFILKHWKPVPLRKASITTILLLLTSLLVYFTSNNLLPSGGCMFWTGDHYESTSCSPRPDNTVIALDSQKLKYFKKINKPDTITYNSIGRVWYSKIKNNLEYYTSPGLHPVDHRVTLKPITEHIITMHIIPLQQTGSVVN